MKIKMPSNCDRACPCTPRAKSKCGKYGSRDCSANLWEHYMKAEMKKMVKIDYGVTHLLVNLKSDKSVCGKTVYKNGSGIYSNTNELELVTCQRCLNKLHPLVQLNLSQ